MGAEEGGSKMDKLGDLQEPGREDTLIYSGFDTTIRALIFSPTEKTEYFDHLPNSVEEKHSLKFPSSWLLLLFTRRYSLPYYSCKCHMILKNQKCVSIK